MPTKASKATQLMIVEDDVSFRTVLRRLLEQQGYHALETDNGKDARNLLGLENVDAVIVDIRLPDTNGIELMHTIKREKRIPVILMSGYSEIGQHQEALELGAAGFLAKPFKKEALLDILRKQLGKLPSETDKDSLDYHYCKISLDDFISGREVKYDIYIRLSSQKYLKIATQGSDLSPDRLKAYQLKGIRFLYMKKEDFTQYIEFNLVLAPAVKSSTTLNKPKKMNFLKATGEMILEDIYMNGVNEESFDNARAVVESTVSLLTEQDDLMGLLELLDKHNDFLYAHSLGVSMYSAMMAKALKWTSQQNLFKVSIGGLLHDIGKKEIEREILAKSRKDLNVDEIKLIETHTMRGVEILRQVRGIPQDILHIVMQHHENCLGMGYPAGLRKHNIHPMARLVSVANEFCNYAIVNPNNLEGMSPHDAIQKIATIHAEQLDHTMVIALMELFKYPGIEEFIKERTRGKYDESKVDDNVIVISDKMTARKKPSGRS